MRKRRVSLINRSEHQRSNTDNKSTADTPYQPAGKEEKKRDRDILDLALQAREANLLGKNGPLHGQDRYLARAKAGSLVVPLDRLSPDVVDLIRDKVDDLDTRTIGKGGELSVSHLWSDGLNLAERSDREALLALGRQMHQETCYRKIAFDNQRFLDHIDYYLDHTQSHRIFIHKKNGQLQAALFARYSPYFFSNELIVSEDLFYIYPDHRDYRLARKMIRALETWADTLSASEICLSISTDIQVSRIEKFYVHCGYKKMGTIHKKYIS